MKNMLNVMSKYLALGLKLEDVVLRATWHPAREVKHEELGHLTVGAPADVAVLRIDRGKFGFTDSFGARLPGTQNLVCELTLRDGKVVYDLNGLTRPPWNKLPRGYKETGDPSWDAVSPARPQRKP
jgi:dihydroorotase